MLPRNHPDRIQIAFDDHRLVNNAGLLLPATLARRLGLPELVRQRLDQGDAPGQANTGDKMMTLVASALARARPSPRATWVLPAPLLPTAMAIMKEFHRPHGHRAPELKSAPGGSAARRPEAARQGLKTGGPERHEQHSPQGDGSRHHGRQRKGLGLNSPNRDVQDPDHRHEHGPEGQDPQPRQAHTGRPTITVHASPPADHFPVISTGRL